MKRLTNPELKVIRFASEDVIATSVLLGKTGTFYIPSGQYSGGSFSGNYVEFNGTFNSYSDGVYGISGIYGAKGDVDSDRDVLISPPPYYFNDTGVTVAGEFMANMSKNIYDAYSYDGQYYTNGISYYDTYWQ